VGGGQLYAAVVASTEALANIDEIDTSEAMKVEVPAITLARWSLGLSIAPRGSLPAFKFSQMRPNLHSLGERYVPCEGHACGR